jgi:histidinol-phosphate aminotransferase
MESSVSEIERLLRPHISQVAAYVTARSQYRGGLLLDANENPAGPLAPDLPVELNRYPDPANSDLRSEVSCWLGVEERRLWFGNGSDEVIDLLIRVLVDPGSPIVVPAPSYTLYAQRAAANGAVVRSVRLDGDFDLDVEGTLAATSGASLVILCSPNNPTGNLLSVDRILELLDRSNCIVAVDEAYVEFAGSDCRAESLAGLAGGAGSVSGSDRLAVLRTFSKAWGLAGARVGYLVGAPTLVDAMDRGGLPYPLSSLSARAACTELQAALDMELARDVIVAERTRVARRLSELGLCPLPSDANFLLFFVEHPREVQDRLAREYAVVIRDRSHLLGLDGGLRVTIGSPTDNDRFLKALGEVLS